MAYTKFKGIRNDQTYRGRFKGSTETHIPNEATRDRHDEMKWDSPQFCEVCFKRPCQCLVKGE